MKKVIEFLLGESDLDGYYFGESPKRKPFFWRTCLRAEWEKQQARISELEQRESELAATVERLRDALQIHAADQVCCGQGEIQYSSEGEPIGQECCGKPDVDWPEDVAALLASAPQQNLNAIKREVLLDLLSTMTCSECTCDRRVEHYVNQRYPDKDGE